jgi:hypothetical protein
MVCMIYASDDFFLLIFCACACACVCVCFCVCVCDDNDDVEGGEYYVCVCMILCVWENVCVWDDVSVCVWMCMNSCWSTWVWWKLSSWRDSWMTWHLLLDRGCAECSVHVVFIKIRACVRVCECICVLLVFRVCRWSKMGKLGQSYPCWVCASKYFRLCLLSPVKPSTGKQKEC